MTRGVGLYNIRNGKELKQRIKEQFRKQGKYWTNEIKKMGLTPSAIELLDKQKTISPKTRGILENILGDEITKYID